MDLINSISSGEEVFWTNPNKADYQDIYKELGLCAQDVSEATDRLVRFAPLIKRLFPETEGLDGLIESPLRAVKVAGDNPFRGPEGKLYIKCDSHLPIAGSIKARGGIYEVLKHTEDLAIQAGILQKSDDYALLADHRDFFSRYTIQVGSTGNLGMSIGIMSAAIGYKAIVHMSADAKEWKKARLRAAGVTVIEYDSDYGEAVLQGRKLSDQNPYSYFVDDERSTDLFLGYATAGERLKKQLDEDNIIVDEKHPLFVYLPCGVGGAPGGITFGLKNIWGNHVHCIFVEPTQAPCMMLALATGLHDQVSVTDYGLSGLTSADGLAVGRASGLVSKMMDKVVDACVTVSDDKLTKYMKDLYKSIGLIIEPSACASLAGYEALLHFKDGYNLFDGIAAEAENVTHIAWATGGSLMPKEVFDELLEL